MLDFIRTIDSLVWKVSEAYLGKSTTLFGLPALYVMYKFFIIFLIGLFIWFIVANIRISRDFRNINEKMKIFQKELDYKCARTINVSYGDGDKKHNSDLAREFLEEHMENHNRIHYQQQFYEHERFSNEQMDNLRDFQNDSFNMGDSGFGNDSNFGGGSGF